MNQLTNNLNSVAAKIEKAKRINAFVATGLCVFVLICLLWPLTVTKFRSVASINIATDKNTLSRDQFESLLADVIRTETLDARLDEIIEQIDVAGLATSQSIEYRDFDLIRKSLQVSIIDQDYGYDYSLGYDGRATDGENELLRVLISRVANRLRPAKATNARTARRQAAAKTVVKIQSDQYQALSQANQIVNRIDDELSSVKRSLSILGDSNASLASKFPNSPGGGQFQLASSQKAVPNHRELTSCMELIDLQPLRSVLSDLHSKLDVQAKLLKRDAMQQAAEQTFGQLVVRNPGPITSRPLHGLPGTVGLLLIGIVSLAAGTVVAIKLKPFDSRGFENARSIGRILDVPVVAQIRSNPLDHLLEKPVKKTWWANRISTAANLILLATLVVIGGFIAVDLDVRAAFLENPFYGCTRIIRIFSGY